LNELFQETKKLNPENRFKHYQSTGCIAPGRTVHLEMLRRLKEAASNRPISFENSYDMGDFTGPKYNYPHRL